MTGASNEFALTLCTLGETRVLVDGDPVESKLPAKAIALIVYLADHGLKAHRSTLAGMLWSDQPEDRARANLRVVLTRLKNEVGDMILADRESVELNAQVTYDAADLATATPDDIMGLYKGDFLVGLQTPGAPLFAEWVEQRATVLRSLALERLVQGSQEALHECDVERAGTLARAATAIDGYDENAQRSARDATAQFDRVRRAVDEELGTTQAARLPSWPTSLIGRDAELVMVTEGVTAGQPFAIVGPGGIGKSRLLGAFASEREAAGETVAWVAFDAHGPTAGDDTVQAFAQTVLATLGVRADSERGTMASLCRYLRNVDQLLCLDNLELLDGIEQALVRLQRECPRVRIAVTSRRRLDLVRVETLELDGLSYDGKLTPAVELFLQRTSRVELAESELAAVNELCTALRGHPLAIELAATWADTAPLTDLLRFLDSSAPPTPAAGAFDLAPRHQSLDAVVEGSFERIGADARQVLVAGTVFAGPFSRDDIESVVPLVDGALAELVRHSLLHIDGGGYQMHPIIRRFARRMASAQERCDLRRAHALRIVDVMTAERVGTDFQQRAGDMQVAIDWMIEHAAADELSGPLASFLSYQRDWGWFLASQETITKALERTDLSPVVRAELHRHAAEALLHAGQYDSAAAELERGIDLVGRRIPGSAAGRFFWNARQSTRLVTAPLRLASSGSRVKAAERARSMSLLGEVFYVSERRSEMFSYSLGSLSAGRVSRDPVLAVAGDAAIAIAAQLAGAHRTSERYRRRARNRDVPGDGDSFTGAEAWGIAALVATGAGEWHDARTDCALAIDAAGRSGRTRMATQLETLLALVDYHQGRYDDGLKRLDEIEDVCQTAGFRRALTWLYATRSEMLYRLGDRDRSRVAAQQALEYARTWGRPEDEARAHVALARSGGDVLYLLEQAMPGLQSPSAFAIQHFELHCGAAELAAEFGAPAPVMAETSKRLRRYAKGFPIAQQRWKQAKDS